MKKILVTLKHIFIPHDQNDYKPHFFREVGVSMLLFISVFLLGSSAGSSFFMKRTVLGAEIASSVLIDLTNESRLAQNEPPLVRNPKLDKAAELKGNDMAMKQYFAHNSPEGVTPWHWFKMAGYNFLYAGENLAINFTDSSEVQEAWLLSPTHRANIMNVEFREVGIATVKGEYNDYPTIYIVQMFGTPAYGKTKDTVTPVLRQSTTTIVQESTSPLVKNTRGAVEGASTTIVTTNATSSTSTTQTLANLEKIVATQETAIVKNTSVELSKIPEHVILPMVSYSTWYEKILFKFSSYIDIIYKGLLLLIAFALVTMVLIEIRKQHYIHIMYGIFLLLLLTLFININKIFI